MPRYLFIVFATLLAPSIALAQSPGIDPVVYSFPGQLTSPASALDAGLALSDRWLGQEPFANPAGRLDRGVWLSPLLVRSSRQDLRAGNRRFDEQAGALDGGGAWIGAPIGSFSLGLYAYQPFLRLEQNAFERGERGGPVEPAVITTSTTAREWRAGLAASTGGTLARVGVGVEWTRREDSYHDHEDSGSPAAGDRDITFHGQGIGYQAGLRLRPGSGRWTLGLAARYLPELSIDGNRIVETRAEQDTIALAARRESGFEGGISTCFAVAPAFRATAAFGARTAQAWRGFGVTTGAASTWSIGGEYHPREYPWTVRFGGGEERQSDVPEPRAAMIGLGFGWRWSDTALDVGLLHRSIRRAGLPNSFDERVIASLHVAF